MEGSMSVQLNIFAKTGIEPPYISSVFLRRAFCLINETLDSALRQSENK